MNTRLYARTVFVTTLVLASFQLSNAGAFDVRNVSVPTRSQWIHSATPAMLWNMINGNGSRLIDLEVETTNPLTFTAAFVENDGAYASGWWWYSELTEDGVEQKITQHNARIISLAPYDLGGETRFAVILVPNGGNQHLDSSWIHGVGPTAIEDLVDETGGRLIDIDRYTVGGQAYWSAVVVENTGADQTGWWWYSSLTAQGVRDKISLHGARIYDLERYVKDGQERFAVIYVERKGVAWWYWRDATPTQVADLTKQHGARIIDIEKYTVGGNPRFAFVTINNSNELTTKIADILDYGNNGKVGVFLKEVNGDELASLYPDEEYYPASSIKVVHLLGAMLRVQSGQWDLSGGTKIPYFADSCNNAGLTFDRALDIALDDMMIDSDNQATNAVQDAVGQDNLNVLMNNIGMSYRSELNHKFGCDGPSSDPANSFGLRDVALLYERIAKGEILDQLNETRFHNIMLNEWNGSSLFSTIANLTVNENAEIGLSPAKRVAFRDAIRLHYKGGSFSQDGMRWLTTGGMISMPYCTGTEVIQRQYVFAMFVDSAPDPDAADAAWSLALPEVFRQIIAENMKSFATLTLCDPSSGGPSPGNLGFKRGDTNGDLQIDISDAVKILAFLFLGGERLACQDAADFNDDGSTDMSDSISILAVLFLGDRPPRGIRFNEIERDTTEDRLTCDYYPQERTDPTGGGALPQ